MSVDLLVQFNAPRAPFVRRRREGGGGRVSVGDCDENVSRISCRAEDGTMGVFEPSKVDVEILLGTMRPSEDGGVTFCARPRAKAAVLRLCRRRLSQPAAAHRFLSLHRSVRAAPRHTHAQPTPARTIYHLILYHIEKHTHSTASSQKPQRGERETVPMAPDSAPAPERFKFKYVYIPCDK